MFVRKQHVRQLELCDRTMFGDLVLTRQSPPITPITVRTALQHTVESPTSKTAYERCAADQEKNVTDSTNDKRRASALVDQLLLDIYKSGTSSVCGYTSTVSFKSQSSFRSEDNFEEKDTAELQSVIGCLEDDVVRIGGTLVRHLRRRDALRRQRDAHCDVITGHLRKRAVESANMRFSIEPMPGDSGFAQWHSAMRMVAQLPGGIPAEFRRKLWLNLAERHISSKNVIWSQVERECFSEWSHPTDGELGVQIVKDLHRTGCSLFCGEDGQENQALLKRVLLAYARWNKSVGYCQGFNMLAALILQVTEKCDTEALKLMIFLIEGVLPESYFADSLRGLSVDMAVFRELLRSRLPQLSRHLDTLQTAAKDGTTSYEPPLTNVFTMQWFLTLFCNCLPQPTVLRVWDLILLEGNEILLRTALAIWQTVADKILSVRSADEFYCIMGVLTREILEFGIVDANALIKAVITIGPLPELPSLREKYLYNINPWGNGVSSERGSLCDAEDKRIKVYGRERLVLDISALKKQYSKLKQRQRQAHIIFSAAVARQTPQRVSSVAMNHLLLGKSALVPIRRIGPPKGSIPPARHPPSTLQWKDTRQHDSSSSSSSDTELCDDPEDVDEDVSLPKASSSKECIQNRAIIRHDDNLNKSSNNLNLMKPDNKTDNDIELRSESKYDSENVPEKLFLTTDSRTGNEFDNQYKSDFGAGGSTEKINEICVNNIFDTISIDRSEDVFTFDKFVVHSDSEDEGFDFEKFLEERVRCLKQTSEEAEDVQDNVEISSKDEDLGRTSLTRRNSRRALEIIQENSLILHRILQCQSRLSPPPVEDDDTLIDYHVQHDIDLSPAISVPEDDDNLQQAHYSASTSVSASLSGCISPSWKKQQSPEKRCEILQELSTLDIISPEQPDKSIGAFNFTEQGSETNYVFDEHGTINKVLDYGRTEAPQADDISSPTSPEKIYNVAHPIDAPYSLSWLENDRLQNTKYSLNNKRGEQSISCSSSLCDSFKSVRNETEPTVNISPEEVKSNVNNIFDNDYSRNLDERYNKLILKSSTPQSDEGESNLKCDEDRAHSKPLSPVAHKTALDIFSPVEIDEQEDQYLDSDVWKSLGESSIVLQSPTTGRIYNPFPVSISSRQKKDVAVRLGLYKKT